MTFLRSILIVVDGVWKSWASWEKCTKTCGGGRRQRTRECTKPMHGGKPCEGDNTDEEECKKDPCPGKKVVPHVLSHRSFQSVNYNIRKDLFLLRAWYNMI